MGAPNCLDRHMTGINGSTCVSAAGSSALSYVVRAVVKRSKLQRALLGVCSATREEKEKEKEKDSL